MLSPVTNTPILSLNAIRARIRFLIEEVPDILTGLLFNPVVLHPKTLSALDNFHVVMVVRDAHHVTTGAAELVEVELFVVPEAIQVVPVSLKV